MKENCVEEPKATTGVRFAFLGTLFAVLVLVLAQSLVPLFRVTPLVENRTLAAFPDPRLFLQRDGAVAFADGLNRWMDDRSGFRDLSIRMKNQIDYSVFRVSQKVYIGANKFLFMRELTDDRLLLERLSEPQFEAVENSFTNLANVLARRGVQLVVVLNPDKSIIYREYLPSNVPNLPAGGRLDRLRSFLGAQPNIIYVDAQDLLMARKSEGFPFYRTDIHWNERGAVPVVKEVIRRIAQADRRPDIAWNEKFQFEAQPLSVRSEDRFLSIMRPLNEMVLTAKNLHRIGGEEPDGHWVMGLPDWRGPFDFEFVSNPAECDHKLPATLLFGTSLTDFWWEVGFHKYFCSVRFSRFTPPNSLPIFMETMPPDTKYFIFQLFAAHLPFSAPEIPEIE